MGAASASASECCRAGGAWRSPGDTARDDVSADFSDNVPLKPRLQAGGSSGSSFVLPAGPRREVTPNDHVLAPASKPTNFMLEAPSGRVLTPRTARKASSASKGQNTKGLGAPQVLAEDEDFKAMDMCRDSSNYSTTLGESEIFESPSATAVSSTPSVVLQVVEQVDNASSRGYTPKSQRSGDASVIAGSEPLEGWLLKRKHKRTPVVLARPLATTSARSVFWKRRYFSVSEDSLSYWPSSDEFDREEACRGVFSLKDVDEVTVRNAEIEVHFQDGQRTGMYLRTRLSLNLRAVNRTEAIRWGAAIRAAAAAQLKSTLPPEWDAHVMLEPRYCTKTGPVRLVAKVPLPEASCDTVQRLLDYTFICKKTRDRSDTEVPLRLEVQEVVRVQNSVAWRKYSQALGRFRNVEFESLQPEVLTATSDDPGFKDTMGRLEESAHERWLFHGTTKSAVQGITDRDFMMDFAGSHRGTLYGKGLYLAECSSKADEYAEEGEEDGLCRMLLCRVALGRVLVDRAKQPSADIVARTKAGYDCLCGDRWAAVGTFREFIFYDNQQIYPAYIVTYKRTKQADLFRAIGAASEKNDIKTAMTLIPHAAYLTETHPDHVVRYRISMLFGAHTNMVARALTEALGDDRRGIRRTAAVALGQLGARAASMLSYVPGLVTADPTDDDNRKAMAAQVVPALTRCLRDEDEEVRCTAAGALEQFGLHAGSAVRALTEALLDEKPSMRTASAKALGQLGVHATPAVGGLTRCLNPEQPLSVRVAAASALGKLGAAAAPALQALQKGLGDEDTEVRKAVAVALGRMGSQHAAPAVEALAERLLDEEPPVRAAAAKALGQLAATSKAKPLAECLQDESPEVRAAAATALGELGPYAAACVPALVECAKDSAEEVQKTANASLGLLLPFANSAVPDLIYKSLKHLSEAVRLRAVVSLSEMGALGQFGEHAALAERALKDRLKDPSEAVRTAAQEGLAYYKRLCPQEECDECDEEEDDDEEGEDCSDSQGTSSSGGGDEGWKANVLLNPNHPKLKQPQLGMR